MGSVFELKSFFILIFVKIKTMAKPIKDTPVLKGQDANNFLEASKKAETNKVSKTELDRIKKNFKKFKAIATFSL